MADAGVPPGAGEPAPAPPPDNIPAQDPTWRDSVFRAGLAVGGVLLVLGIASHALGLIAPTLASLIICSGLGIIFGAFGSTAVIRYKGIVIAGVAGIAIALLLLVDYLVRDDIVRIRISGDVRGARVDLVSDETLPGADHGEYFEFVVVGREIKSQNLILIVTLPPSAARNNEEMEVTFDCVPPDAVAKFLGSGTIVSWRFDATRQRLVFAGGGSLSSGPCDNDTPSISRNGGFFFPAAYAQEQPELKQLLLDLESESAVIRRDARNQVSLLGTPAIAPLMARWEKEPDSYRVRLGASVALAEFLRDHKDQRREVAAVITDHQMELLAEAAGDPDRTIRVYASEFLFDLGDTRAVKIAESLFDNASDDGKFNLLIVIEGAIPDLKDDEKKALADTLRGWRPSVGAKTQKLIDKLLSGLG